jgi:hypothetical protein
LNVQIQEDLEQIKLESETRNPNDKEEKNWISKHLQIIQVIQLGIASECNITIYRTSTKIQRISYKYTDQGIF